MQDLYKFYKAAGLATYAGGGKAEQKPERPGFREFHLTEGDFDYRDSYSGYYRSRGTEVIRYQGKPIWCTLYGGGMVKGKEDLADEAFGFLKKALSAKEPGFSSVRGPQHFVLGKWSYQFHQKGELDEFSGYEEIFFDQQLVFFHHIIGGEIRDKS